MENQTELQEVVANVRLNRDAALGHLVLAANVGASFGLTLCVEGQIIYGDTISGADYCEEMYNTFANTTGDQATGAAIGGFFLQLKETSYVKDDASEIPLNFIHLKNVSYLKGDGSLLNNVGSLLRVGVDKVSAFSVGRPE